MNCYHHLNIEEREQILIKREKGETIKQIAQALGRNKSTISRELKRNFNTYSAIAAQRRYVEARTHSVRRYKLSDITLKNKVTDLLNKYWSPEQISNRLKLEKRATCINTCTIYRGFDNGLIDSEYRKLLRHKGRQRHGGHGKSKCGHLNIEHTIHDRPKNIEKRKRIGHWESDVVRGSRWSGCIATHVERKSRYVLLCKMPNRSADSMNQAMLEIFQRVGSNKCLSMTTDHGKEFAKHRDIAKSLNCKVYFADPMSPWQRGTNENTNGLIRQFFPKRTSFESVTQQDVDRVADIINRRPRKCLGWKSPFEVFFQKSLHFT